MTGKITATVATAIPLASAAVASAAPNAHRGRTSAASHSYYDFVPEAPSQAPRNDYYYNQDYWNGVNGVAPTGIPARDPFAGTVLETLRRIDSPNGYLSGAR